MYVVKATYVDSAVELYFTTERCIARRVVADVAYDATDCGAIAFVRFVVVVVSLDENVFPNVTIDKCVGAACCCFCKGNDTAEGVVAFDDYSITAFAVKISRCVALSANVATRNCQRSCCALCTNNATKKFLFRSSGLYVSAHYVTTYDISE